jgi:hypothetical protein
MLFFFFFLLLPAFVHRALLFQNISILLIQFPILTICQIVAAYIPIHKFQFLNIFVPYDRDYYFAIITCYFILVSKLYLVNSELYLSLFLQNLMM